jgi:hypothetical protein
MQSTPKRNYLSSKYLFHILIVLIFNFPSRIKNSTSTQTQYKATISVSMNLMPRQLVVAVVLLLASLCGNNFCNANAVRLIRNIVARKAITVRPAAGKLLRRTAKNRRKVNVENRVFEDLLWGPSSFFTWDASIDGPTGVASSKERSGPFALTKKSTTRSAQSRKRQRKRRIIEEERLIIETSRKFCTTWPDFLCQGSVSFGFLRCVKTEEEEEEEMKIRRSATTITKRQNRIPDPQSLKTTTTKSMEDNRASLSLRPRFLPFPLTFLEFGKMVESSSNDNNYKNGNDDNGLVVLGSWDIPLNDGFLILQQKPHQQQQRSNNCYRGKLIFAIAKTKKTPYGGKRKNNKDDDEESSPRYQIITRIVDYQPWLAGGGWSSSSASPSSTTTDTASTCDNTRTHIEPTRRLRHSFYLSTQSVVHAYMTWRFHRTWRNKLSTALMIEDCDLNDKYYK